MLKLNKMNQKCCINICMTITPDSWSVGLVSLPSIPQLWLKLGFCQRQVSEQLGTDPGEKLSLPWGKQMHLLYVNSLQEESLIFSWNYSLEKPQLFVASHDICERQVWSLKSVHLSSTWENQATEVVGLFWTVFKQWALKCWLTPYKTVLSQVLFLHTGKPCNSLRNVNCQYLFLYFFHPF